MGKLSLAIAAVLAVVAALFAPSLIARTQEMIGSAFHAPKAPPG